MKQILNERGLALALTVIALVMIGALVAGSLFMSVQEHRAGLSSLRAGQAFAAAEAGGQIQLAEWNQDGYSRLAAGDSVTFDGWLIDGSGWYRGSLRRLNDMLYLVRSEGFSRDSATRRHLGTLVRIQVPELPMRASAVVRGPVVVRGAARLDGTDQIPTGWTSCGATEPDTPGLGVTSTADVTEQGNAHDIVGDPPIQEDPTLDATAISDFGALTFDDLFATATKILLPGNYARIDPVTSGGECVTADPVNWGDPLNPTSPCGDYFPAVGVAGDLRLNTGQGQGLLMVDGNLRIQGGMEFYGLIIVSGTLTTSGTGSKFNGSIIVINENNLSTDIAGNAGFSYSSCALEKAFAAIGKGAPMRERGWVQLY